MNLRAQLEAVQAQMEAEKALGLRKDAEKIAMLEKEEARILEAIMEAENEERVHQSVSTFDNEVESWKFGDMSFRQLVGESEYQLVMIKLKKLMIGQAEKFGKQINEIQSSYNDQLRAANDREEQLQRQNSTLQQTIDQQEKDLQEERLNRAQAEQYRDNAISQLDEAKEQIKQLKDWRDRLQAEAAIGVKGEMSVVVVSEEEARLEKELNEKIKRERTIYGLEWTDEIRKNRYRAKLAANDEPIEFNWTEKTKYTVIDESEVLSFRNQYAEPERHNEDPALDANQPLQIAAPEIVTEFQFQPGNEHHNQPAAWGDGSPEAPPIEGSVQDTEDLSGPASRAELKALQERVATLESSIAQRAA